tara:strand:- start:554 stop:3781 length:3228 start_codon:yes stop_codon:yes gene_type:complete
MADPIIKFKRSAVAGKKPTIEQLPLGELAINTYDGKLFLRQDTGGVGIATRVVEIGTGTTAGKTFFVTSNGSDSNTGLSIGESFASIKTAAAAAVEKDTIKVLPGTYVENNPIYLPKNVGVEGAELRNCLVSAQNPGSDLFYVGQGNHITDLSFIGQPATGGAAVIAYTPLVGVSTSIYFDAANLIRQNAQYIAHESVGYVTSTDYKSSSHTITDAQYSPITGILTATIANHGFNTGDVVQFDHASITFQCSYGSGGNEAYPRPSDYAMNRDLPITKIDANTFKVNILETAPSTNTGIHTFISATTNGLKRATFNLGVSSVTNCVEDVASILNAVTHDITRGGNSKSVGAGLSYYDGTSLQHIVGVASETIDVFYRSANISRSVINNATWGSTGSGISSAVTGATYDRTTGVMTVTAPVHGLIRDDAVKISGIGFTCEYSGTPTGNAQTFTINVSNSGASHYVLSGADRSVTHSSANDPTVTMVAGDTINFVVNASGHPFFIKTAASTGTGDQVSNPVATNNGTQSGTVSWTPTTAGTYYYICQYHGAMLGTITVNPVVSATEYPDGSFGYTFPVKRVVNDNSFEVVVGVSTVDHYYYSGSSGTVLKQRNYYDNKFTQVRDRGIQPSGAFNDAVNGCATAVSAIFTCVGIVTSIVENGPSAFAGASGITTQFPGNNGIVNSGILTATLSPSQGTGPITKGPYIRNCTNFIANSIGAKIDGFNADVGDLGDTVGVQGSFNVDSYTQYNQGGIGVSVTNGAYAQLVSIFTICNDRAIYSGGGGQLDLTNSNSSFGREGLVSEGTGDNDSKCLDRYSATVGTTTNTSVNYSRGNNVVTVQGVGTFRPYRGQSIFFNEKYFAVQGVTLTNVGSGYSTAPLVSVTAATGPGNAITAQLTSNINAQGEVTGVNIITTGFQYTADTPPVVTFAAPVGGGVTATCTTDIAPILYTVDEATLPSNGISTVTLVQNLNNDVGFGSTAYFSRQSLQIASSHSFEYVGAGNAIETARPSKGGVTVTDNEVIKINGGECIYTSTDQDGNFRIGDGVVIDQTTGTISGSIYVKSLFSQVTPFILALGGD